MKNPSRLGTIKITILYGIVFLLWIFFRNRIFLLFGGEEIKYTFGQTVIDLAFGFITALSIYFLIKYYQSVILKEANKFESLIDNASAVIFAKRPDNRYIFINKQFEQLFHISNKEIMGATDKEVWSKEFAEKFVEYDNRVFQTGVPMTFEETAPQDDGLHTYITVKFPIRDFSGRIYAVGGIATDVTHIKKMEEELEYSLALSKATLESTTDGILVVSRDAERISGFNQNFVKMWHIPKELIDTKIDKYLLDYVTIQLQDPQRFRSKVLDLYGNPEKESFDVLELADGRTFERYSKPQIARNEIIGRVWSFRDVTEKRRAEADDKKRVSKMIRFQETFLNLAQIDVELPLNKKFDKILKLTSEAMEIERVSIWLYNSDHSSIYTDNIFSSSLQEYLPGVVLNRSDYPEYFKAMETFHIIDAHDAVKDFRTFELTNKYLKPVGISSMLDTLIKTGGNNVGIICMEHTGPRRIWSYDEHVFSSSIAAIIATFLEQDARRQSEEKYRFLTEIVPQQFWTAMPDGKIDYYNSNVYQYTGKSFEELKDWRWQSIVHPDDLNHTLQVWNESVKTGNKYALEYRLAKKNGEYRWHLSRSSPQKDAEGNVIKWFGTTTDIHDQRTLLEELKQKNTDLSRINNDLDNFIYTASHDLKAPIANIEGLLNTLIDSSAKEYLKEEEPNIIINMIIKSIEKFKLVIKDLTEISRAQKSNENENEVCSFPEIVEEIKHTIAPIIKESKTKIQYDFDQISTITFSKKNLRSILYNLISNAIKYRSKDRDSIVSIQTEKTGDYILLSIKDNGLGIRPEIAPQMFRMFKRYHTHVEGSGIGLYIVKRIVENAEGKIEVESEEGKGSTFKIYFKLKLQPVPI